MPRNLTGDAPKDGAQVTVRDLGDTRGHERKRSDFSKVIRYVCHVKVIKCLKSFQHNANIQTYGAPTRTRTADLLITNQLLYQLSYRGAGEAFSRGVRAWQAPLHSSQGVISVIPGKRPIS